MGGYLCHSNPDGASELIKNLAGFLSDRKLAKTAMSTVDLTVKGLLSAAEMEMQTSCYH